MNDEGRTKKTVMSDMVPVSRQKKNAEKPKPVPVAKKIAYNPVKEPELVRETFRISEKNPASKSGCGVWIVGIVCAAILALVIGGFIATATVDVVPKQFSGAVDATVTLSQTVQTGDLRFYTATQQFSEDQVIPAQATVGQDQFATGTVRFYNASTQPILLPAKTIIETQDAGGQMLQYQTKENVTIPNMSAKKPGQKDVAVTAVAAGGDSNIGLSDFTLVTPVSGVTAHSVSEMTGGAQASDKIASPAQIVTAQNDLLQNFSPDADFTGRLLEQLPKDMIALPITFSESTPTITVDPHFDDGVHVIATASVTVTMVRRSDLARFLGDQLNAPQGIGLTMSSLGSLSVTTETLASPETVPETMAVRITGNAAVSGDVHPADIQHALLGISRGQAKTYLSAIPEIKSFAIHMMPFWRTVFPTIPDRISVTTVN